MPPPIPIPAIVFFDAVGTLIHPDPPAAAVYESVGRRFGSRLDGPTIRDRFRAAFRRQEGADHAGNLRTDEPREMARWQAIVREVLDDVEDIDACFRELYAHFARVEAWRCEAKTAEVLSTLALRGHILGIASNFDRRLRGLVANMPAFAPVRHLVISSEIGWRKPAREFYEALWREANTAPEHILYVGDDPINDYGGARAARLQALLLAPHESLSAPARSQIRSLSDLL